MAVHQLDAGNGLFYLQTAPRRPDAPTFVFVNALTGSTDHWEAVVAHGGVRLFMDALFPLIVNQDFAAAARPDFLKGGYRPLDPDHPHLNLMRHAVAADWGIDWSALELPVLNITGLQDRVFYEPEAVERLYATLPDARREDWADCGHLIPIERPQRLAESPARFGGEIEAQE